MIDVRERVDDLSPHGWTLLAAVAFGLGAMVTAVLVSVVLVGAVSFRSGLVLGVIFAPGVGLVGLIVGGTLWGILVEARRTYSDRNCTLAGALTGILAHFVMPMLYNLGTAGIPENFAALRESFNYVIVSGTVAFLLTGIFTVPAGAFIGWQLARLRRSIMEDSTAPRAEDSSVE
jgi:hypothetical protein